MDNFEKTQFKENFESVLFEESTDSKYDEARKQRKTTAILFHALNTLPMDNVSGSVLTLQELKKYSKLTDNLKGVNNYADILKSIIPSKTEVLNWESDLNSNLTELQNKAKSPNEFELRTPEIHQLQESIPKPKPTVPNMNFQNQRPALQQNKFFKQKQLQNTTPTSGFITARQDLVNQQNHKNTPNQPSTESRGFVPKKTLGMRGNLHKPFLPPDRPVEEQPIPTGEETDEDPRLKNIDAKMIELIRSEIMDTGTPITWDDIAGLEFAKKTIQEIVVWPLLRPDIFTGLRRPPKGILLFGPPGTGKTLIGKCIACQSQSTFFSISASSLTSKWIGDGEKMVRALFAVARCHQPAVIFIDEIDSILTQRSDTEHESSRRMKTEFLVQLDGAATGDEDRILIIGATNRPQELDEAARRRLVKRLYIPLPEFAARKQLVCRLMSSERNELAEEDIDSISSLTEGYSGADMKNLCAEASLGPIRSIHFSQMQNIQAEEVRPINFDDFKSALTRVRASVSSKDLEQYVVWDNTYGSGAY